MLTTFIDNLLQMSVPGGQLLADISPPIIKTQDKQGSNLAKYVEFKTKQTYCTHHNLTPI